MHRMMLGLYIGPFDMSQRSSRHCLPEESVSDIYTVERYRNLIRDVSVHVPYRDPRDPRTITHRTSGEG